VLATGGAEKRLRIFDLNRNSSSTSSSNGTSSAVPTSTEIGEGAHTSTIKSIVWTPNDPNILITAADDKKIRWWDLRSRTSIAGYTVEGSIGSCEINTSTARSSATPTSASNSILSVAAGKSVYFFDGAGLPGTLLKSHTLPQQVDCVAINMAEGKFVTGGGGDTWVHVYDFEKGEELEIGKGHHGPVWSVAYSPDGRLYATGSEDGTIKLWKNTAGQYGLWR